MKFETWLRKQKKRDDPIGDLAKDFISSRKTFLTMGELRFFNACDGAIEAFKEAVKEYLGEVRKELMK